MANAKSRHSGSVVGRDPRIFDSIWEGWDLDSLVIVSCLIDKWKSKKLMVKSYKDFIKQGVFYISGDLEM